MTSLTLNSLIVTSMLSLTDLSHFLQQGAVDDDLVLVDTLQCEGRAAVLAHGDVELTAGLDAALTERLSRPAAHGRAQQLTLRAQVHLVEGREGDVSGCTLLSISRLVLERMSVVQHRVISC